MTILSCLCHGFWLCRHTLCWNVSPFAQITSKEKPMFSSFHLGSTPRIAISMEPCPFKPFHVFYGFFFPPSFAPLLFVCVEVRAFACHASEMIPHLFSHLPWTNYIERWPEYVTAPENQAALIRNVFPPQTFVTPSLNTIHSPLRLLRLCNSCYLMGREVMRLVFLRVRAAL